MLILTSQDHEPAPKMKVLMSMGTQARAEWETQLAEFDVLVAQYRQTHPHYVPRLSQFVHPPLWRRISRELVNPEDRTGKGPPNNVAVEALLRREGKYASTSAEAGKMPDRNALETFGQMKWVIKPTHVEG